MTEGLARLKYLAYKNIERTKCCSNSPSRGQYTIINKVYPASDDREVNNHIAEGGWQFLVIFHSLFAMDKVTFTY